MGTTWASFSTPELYPVFERAQTKPRGKGNNAQIIVDRTMSMSREKRFDKGLSPAEERSTLRWVAGNGLTLEELEQLEEAAHHSQTIEAKSVLRLAAALREALQLKECALYTKSEDNPRRIRKGSPGGHEQ